MTTQNRKRAFQQHRTKTDLPRLQRRGGRFYLRVKIPKDLIEAYRRLADDPDYPGGVRREVVRRLEARELDEAKVEAAGLSKITNIEFRDKRKAQRGAELDALGIKRGDEAEVRSQIATATARRRRRMHDVKVVTRGIVDKIHYSILRRLLDEDEEDRLNPDRRDFIAIATEQREPSVQAWQQCISTGITEPFHDAARMEAGIYHYKVAANAEGIERLAFGVVQAYLLADQFLRQRDQGNAVVAETIAPMTRTAMQEDRASGTTLRDLYAVWLRSKERPKKTADTYLADLKEFDTFLYEREKKWVEEVTTDDWREYSTHLLSGKQKARTARRKLGTVRTIFNVAAKEGKVPSPHPLIAMRIELPQKKPRLPFTVEEMQKIFDSPIFRQGWRPRGKGGEAYYWLPLIACWTGAREEEIAQLRVEDVKKDTRHGTYLWITNEHKEQKLKNEGSRRRVPLHTELIRCGFLDFVDKQQQLHQEWLFNEMKADRYGRRSSSFGKGFMRYLRKKLKIKDPTRTFHSFRHSWKDAARDSDIDPALIDAIAGHRDATAGAKYGAELYPLKPLFRAMRKFKVDGLDIGHLHTGGGQVRKDVHTAQASG